MFSFVSFVLLFLLFKRGAMKKKVNKRKETNKPGCIEWQVTHKERMQQGSHCHLRGYLQYDLKCKHTSEDIVCIA